MVGRTISHYHIVEKLGEGGMGVVYKARDTRLDRPVALKFLNPAPLADPDRRARFIQEARAASALNHPNIIVVHDIETAGDDSFIVMEFVPGRTLRHCIGRTGVPPGDAIRWLTQVADALSAAHTAGIVHRDLKPSNIVISDSGVAKLLDFGVAKLTEPVADSATTVTAEAALTGRGSVLGTIEYMSPEQARGEPVDQRTDVWAFGCLIFELLTGRKAFGGHSTAETMARILGAEPDWTAVPASTPPALRRLMRQCLQKDRLLRLRHLDPMLLSELDADEPPAEPRRRGGSRAAIGMALAVAVAAGLGGWLAGRAATRPVPPPAPPVVRLSMPFTPFDQAGAWSMTAVAVAPDGSVAYVGRAADGRRQLYLRRIDRQEGVALPATEGAASPFFAPDGSAIGFFADGRLKKVVIASGVVQSLSNAQPYGGAWLDDNTIVFTGPNFSNGLMRVAASGGTPDELTRLLPGEAAHRWPALSPTAPVVVFVTTNTAGLGLEQPRLVAQSLETGQREFLPVDATYAAFAPDGAHLLLVRNGTVVTQAFDAARLALTGSPVPLLEGVMQASSGAAQVSAARSVLAYLPGAPEARRLVWVDRDGRVEPIDAPPRLYVHPRLSPDGQKIAVLITDPGNDIWVFDIARGTLSRLTVEGGNAYPIWTRDGSMITYVSGRNGQPANLFWRRADGTGSEERLVTSENIGVSESWAPGGMLLYVELRKTTGWDILALAVSGSRVPQVFLGTPFNDTTPQISPSGRFVAHGSDETGRPEVVVHSFPTPDVKIQVSTGGGGQSGWRGDERELYFRSGDAMMVADVMPEPRLSIGRPRVLFRGDFAPMQGKNYDVTTDGRRFVMVQAEAPITPREIRIALNWMEDATIFARSK